MRMMGFGRDEKKDVPDPLVIPNDETMEPVVSLVRVRFDCFDKELTYFNDRFDLKEGDRVFVSGKLAGKIGYITSVSTKFKIRLSDYERVIAVAQTPIHGSYVPVIDKMLSYDSIALSPEAFRTWFLPPEEKNEDENYEIVYGDGYVIPLDDPHSAEDVDHAVFERAMEYLRSGRIGYVSVKNGVGRAYVQGREWYELEFRLHDGRIEGAYCGCLYAGLCKHLLAVAIMLSVFANHGKLDLARDFVLIDANRFYEMIRHNDQTVTV